MTTKQLIEILNKMPPDMEVVTDYDDGYSTGSIFKVEIGAEYHDDDFQDVVIIY